MTHTTPTLQWIDAQAGRMREMVRDWASINSGSLNIDGVEMFRKRLGDAFAPLGGELRVIDLEPLEFVTSGGTIERRPLGRALSIRKRPEAPLRVFLGIHMDTVYGAEDEFQTVTELEGGRMGGPGVADAKGGIAVMLIALEAFERSPLAEKLGIEVLLNPDEEISSPGSLPLLREAAKRNHLGLVYEPCLPNGNLIGRRKGSGNFSLVVRGRSAHAGRDHAEGRNAIAALARAIGRIAALTDRERGVTANVGKIEGGGAVNRVPDLAIARFNIRVTDPEDIGRVKSKLGIIATEAGAAEGFSAELHGGFPSPPKPLDNSTRGLLERVASCGKELGLAIEWESSGGVCDGNKLAAAGLPTVDTMGPRGGDIHSPAEYLELDSLTERAKLTALLLIKLASGEIEWKT